MLKQRLYLEFEKFRNQILRPSWIYNVRRHKKNVVLPEVSELRFIFRNHSFLFYSPNITLDDF